MHRIIFLILLLPAVALATETPRYVGIEQCKLCHLPHFESWDGTRMSKAFELLKPGVRADAKRQARLDPNRDYTTDPKCLKCHVTGFGLPGGFISMEQTPQMANVQCEMCHGPGSVYMEMMLKPRGTYVRADYMAQGGLIMPSVEQNVCAQQCHNSNSPFVPAAGYNFDFEDRKAIGTHRHDLQYIDLPFDILSE